MSRTTAHAYMLLNKVSICIRPIRWFFFVFIFVYLVQRLKIRLTQKLQVRRKLILKISFWKKLKSSNGAANREMRNKNTHKKQGNSSSWPVKPVNWYSARIRLDSFIPAISCLNHNLNLVLAHYKSRVRNFIYLKINWMKLLIIEWFGNE